MRRAWGVVLAAVLAGATACGSESGGASAPSAASVQLSPPGTSLAAGLVVPVGTQLVGPVFPGRSAVLQIDGDPFAAWDELATQAQAIGAPIPGSGVCRWLGPSNHETPVSEARPDLAGVLDCMAAANGSLPDGAGVRITMRLWWFAAGAELHVELMEGDVSDLVPVWPDTGDPGPAPAAASAQLPERDAPVVVETGDPFGQENNCFESGYDRLTLPDGARLVGGGTTPGLRDFAAVLAVDDPEAVLEALRDQLDEPDSSDGNYQLSEGHLTDGTSIWTLSGSVSAGGGACGMSSSPDGTAVLVTTWSD
jgi:hypothetical protein